MAVVWMVVGVCKIVPLVMRKGEALQLSHRLLWCAIPHTMLKVTRKKWRRLMATRLRHIAIIVPDPEKAATFFEQAFGMTRAGTARRGVYMSDGVMNVALLKTEGNEKPGLYHFGMWVDDLDEAEKKVTQAG